MREASRTRPETSDAGFDVRDWITVLVSLGAVMLGAVLVLGAAYWLFLNR